MPASGANLRSPTQGALSRASAQGFCAAPAPFLQSRAKAAQQSGLKVKKMNLELFKKHGLGLILSAATLDGYRRQVIN